MNVPAPLNVREAAVADLAALGVKLTYLHKNDTADDLKNRFAKSVTHFLHPETAPIGLDPRVDLFPSLYGLYPSTFGTDDAHVRGEIESTLADVLATSILLTSGAGGKPGRRFDS